MNAAAPENLLFCENRRGAKCGLRSMRGVICAAGRHNKLHNSNLQRITIRSARRLQTIASASKISFDDAKVIKAIDKDFLHWKRLANSFRTHLRNSPTSTGDDCTYFAHRKQKRFRSALSSFFETGNRVSQLVSLAFEFLKINHLRRLPPKQVL